GEPELTAAQRRMHRLLAPRMAGFIAASSAARRRLASLGVDPALIELSLQSADLELFREASGAPRAGLEPLRVLAVGRLVRDKNLVRLVEAFGEAGVSDRAELVLCGAGPLEDELRSLAARLSQPVRFRGYVPPDDLPGVY